MDVINIIMNYRYSHVKQENPPTNWQLHIIALLHGF